MLTALTVRDFVIVEYIELAFMRGFTALTGETGAGKSILIDALALVLGERGDATIVRPGASKADISAEFDASGNASLQQWLSAHELADDDSNCLLRRVIDSGGRSRAFINGRTCTLLQLREAGEHLIDIHGQHEHQSLMRSGTQRSLLDAYAGCANLATEVAVAWQRWRELRQQCMALETQSDTIAAEREQLEELLRDIGSLRFSNKEWEEIQTEHGRLAHGQSLIEGTNHALEILSEGERSALNQLAAIASRLGTLLEYDPQLNEIRDVVTSAQAETQEATYMLRDYHQRLEIDPQRFKNIEQKLDAVHAMARKWRIRPEEFSDAMVRSEERLKELGENGNIELLRTKIAEAGETYLVCAKKLTAARKKAAKALSEKVTIAMQTLAMSGGRFEVALTPLDEGNLNGHEQIDFLVSVHRETDLRPLAKVASGGELSRISLALQTALSEVARVPTMIFDEVDSGIGGGIAEIVGRMLNKLGAKHQVMCVTHLPQVAAAADQQWQVVKSSANGKMLSRVAILDDKQRVEEIARMLGGVKITTTTRQHAAEMLGTALKNKSDLLS